MGVKGKIFERTAQLEMAGLRQQVTPVNLKHI